MLLYTLLALISIVLVQGQNGTLPRLPSGFTVDIEANLLDSNKTLNIREYYNKDLGFQRIEINTVDSYTYTITNYNSKEVYTISDTPSSCTVAPLGTDTFSTARSVEDILLFGDNYVDSYTGVFIVRGVPCDSWISYLNFSTNGTTLSNGTAVNGVVVHNLVLQYYFTVPSWAFRANVTRKPMRTVLNGTRTFSDGSIQTILHNYEFVNFVPKPPTLDAFALPDVCVNYSQRLINALSSSTGGGLAAGMFFLGLFIGAGVCGLSIWVYCRRRQLARDRFAKSNSLAMQENNE